MLAGPIHSSFIQSVTSPWYLLTKYQVQVRVPSTEYHHLETPLGYKVRVFRHNFNQSNALQGLEMKLVKPSKTAKKAKLVFENNHKREREYTYDLEEIDANNITWDVKLGTTTIVEVVIPKKPSKGEILQKRQNKRKLKSQQKHKSEKSKSDKLNYEDAMEECEALLYKVLYNETLDRFDLDIWSEPLTPEASDTE